jgi:hypothetical protein
MPIDFPLNPTEGQILTSNTKSWVYISGAWKAYNSVNTVANNVVKLTIATDGQTSFTTPTYVQGLNQIRVFINGVRQNNITDYTETSSNTITLTSGVAATDNVVFEVSTYAGSPVVIGYPSVVNDGTTNAIRYPVFTSITGGALTVVNTDTADLSYNPSDASLTSTNINTSTLTANNINIGLTNPTDILDYIITYNLAFG